MIDVRKCENIKRKNSQFKHTFRLSFFTNLFYFLCTTEFNNKNLDFYATLAFPF